MLIIHDCLLMHSIEHLLRVVSKAERPEGIRLFIIRLTTFPSSAVDSRYRCA
jgi:hypothetical protein